METPHENEKPIDKIVTETYDHIVNSENVQVHAATDKYFPNRRGIWLHGSLEKGIIHVEAELLNPMNVRSAS